MKSDRYEDMIVSDDANEVVTSCPPLLRAPWSLFTTLDACASIKLLLNLTCCPDLTKSSFFIA